MFKVNLNSPVTVSSALARACRPIAN